MSKLSRLRDNIAAIEHALKGGNDREVLKKYTGFGGLGFVLNPLDKAAWSKSDLDCYADTVRLHEVLKKHSKDEQEYNRWMQSLKASTLTAYYTPEALVNAVMMVIYGGEMVEASGVKGEIHKAGHGIRPKTFLDPAAGKGVFMDGVCSEAIATFSKCKMVAYEKDLLTGMLLKRCWGDGQDIRVAGFETIPASELGTYDLVSTNVPFGQIQVYDPDYTNSKSEVRRDAAKMIHRYYVLKGLDCLRDGGLLAYIITSNYLNRDDAQLAEALKQSRLIGAYRLANNLFKESGTEVGTDLLVLQKDTKKDGLTADESMLLTQYEEEGCPTNLYFACYPDHVIATSWTVGTDAYGKRAFEYHHQGGVLGISEDVRKILADDLARNLSPDPSPKREGSNDTQGDKTNAKSGSDRKAQGGRKADKKSGPDAAKVLAMVAIYGRYTTLYEYEAENMKENKPLRDELNALYDDFVGKYGCLNKSENARMAKWHEMAELLSLEVRQDGRWQKADIMLKPVAFSTDDLHTAGTPQEALAQSLNDYGRPDMAYMMAMTGMDEDALIDALAGEVYYNPLSEEYEIKAKFICGDVITKAEEVRRKLGVSEDDVADQTTPDPSYSGGEMMTSDTKRRAGMMALHALEDARPTAIPFEDLDFNLGERWVDARVYGQFASEFFSMPDAKGGPWGGNVTVTVKYDALVDQYDVSRSGWSEKVGSVYAVSSEASQSLDGMDLLVHALLNTCPKMQKYRRDSDGYKVMTSNGRDYEKEEDTEKTQLANTKIEEIRQGYVDWLLRQPKDFRDHLADVYNRRFNCFVKPKYDGSHQTFPGLDREGLREKFGIKEIYQSQKDCVWMLMLNGGGICDHEVGSGKTLIMVMAAHEMKRLGFCHKPMIIGLKANVSAIADTYRTAYPEARILFATEKDYTAKERVAFFNNAKNNDYDCIIMSHDQFGRIPQSDTIQLEIMRDEIRQLEDALEAMGWGDKRIRRGLEVRKRTLEARIMKLQDEIKKGKDDVTDFNLLGIDHIFVDESHQFKNLGFSSRHDRVAGMGNTEGSKRAYNLLMAIRTIQKRTGKDLGATFLSGTTVTNSLTELYSLFRYLRPKALARQQITCFDAWAAIFTKKSQEFEFSITNQIVLKERFRYFIKVPELAQFYNEITDFRTVEDVGIERPRKHAMLLNIKPTPDQEDFIKTLMEFAKTGDFRLIGMEHPTDKQKRAKMLYATDMARKMSLDMRMISPAYGDHPRSKASRCAQLVKRYYDQYDAQKGTQLIFSDLSTWQGTGKGWSVYGEIKRKLVEEYGIPAKEVRFIQECKSDSAKQRLIADVNAGRVRVLFGSTSMLGTGVNAQQRVVAVHHLDTPWRPSDLEQRDGRAIRKGNEVAAQYAGNQVDVIIYAVERSLDSYKFNLLHCKQTFINQLKRGQLNIRTLDEGSFDENTGMNFSEYMAILSGNTDLLDRAKLEKKIAALEGERKNFYRQQREQEQKRDLLQRQMERLESQLAQAKADGARYNRLRRVTDEGEVMNCLTIDNYTLPADCQDTDKALGEQLLRISRTAHTHDVFAPIGSVYGFRLVVRTEKVAGMMGEPIYENRFFVEGETKVNGEPLRYTHNDGRLNHASPRNSARNPLLALERIAQIIEGWQAKIEEGRTRISQLDAILGATWGKEDELRHLKADLGKLDRKINEELNGNNGGRKSSNNSHNNDRKAKGKNPLAQAA